MSVGRVHGDVVAHSFGLDHAPAVATRSLAKSQVRISRLSFGAAQLGMSASIPPEDTFVLAIYLTDVARHEMWRGGKPYLNQGYAAYSARIVNLQEGFSAYVAQPQESLSFYIPRVVLNEFTDETDARRVLALAYKPGASDPILKRLAQALLPVLERVEEAESLFVDHLTLALCAHLVSRYGGVRLAQLRPAPGLSIQQAERAKELLAANFDRDISLAEVARDSGLSRSYFTKAFKAATEMTPHQWRQRYRIEMAKAMLRDGRLPIAEIALACGFADQSHLTRIFTRTVGEGPARWRRSRR